MDALTKRRSLHETEKNAAYEYLCRLDEAKRWMESIIHEELPSLAEIGESLCNGVILCKVGMKLLPNDPQWKKVYDFDQSKFHLKGLDFRHTDNINFFIACLTKLGLPKIFHPTIADVFQKKNQIKLIYCLHALSHLLKQQGKMDSALNEEIVKPKFTDDELSQATQTLRTGEAPSFEIVNKLVEEELQYTMIDIYNKGVTEEEEQMGRAKNSSTLMQNVIDRDDSDDDLFDDPKYFEVSGTGHVLTGNDAGATILQPLLENLKCHGVGITANVYDCNAECTSNGTVAFNKALLNINDCVDAGAPLETLRALQKPDSNLPFPYLEAEDYQNALEVEKKEGLPKNALVIYSGLQRSLCDTLLDRMRPGAYLLRQSTTLTGKDYVFSFRNEIGIKHWKLNINDSGQFTWGSGNNSFDSFETFVKYFVDALSRVTKLYIYPGTSFMLKVNPSLLTAEQSEVLDKLKVQGGNGLSYGQLAFVITDVNSRIRRLRAASSKEKLSTSSDSLNRDQGKGANPLLKLNMEMMAEDPWNESLLVSVSRAQAEDLLDKEGYPGSFLVRPSERAAGDCALAFRTRTEIRHWKIIKKNNKYYVHPRPNPYNSVSDIVQHFRDAVGAETGLVMTPLISTTAHNTNNISTINNVEQRNTSLTPLHDESNTLNVTAHSVPPPPPPARTARKGSFHGYNQPSPSLSRLNPANITSWSSKDVTQWLVEQGLGQFASVFEENCVDGECLLTLDNNLLKDDLGISQLGYRSRIIKRVQQLKQAIHPEYTV